MTRQALTAIVARIKGEWDNPALVKFGALSTNTPDDILRIASESLRDNTFDDARDVLRDLIALYEASAGRDPAFVAKGRAILARMDGAA